MSTTVAHAMCQGCAWSANGEDVSVEQRCYRHEDSTGHRVDVHYLGDRG